LWACREALVPPPFTTHHGSIGGCKFGVALLKVAAASVKKIRDLTVKSFGGSEPASDG
jgi:hypothetical protein